jgi:serine protease Do
MLKHLLSKYLPFFLSAFAGALLAVVLYRRMEPPRSIILQNPVSAKAAGSVFREIALDPPSGTAGVGGVDFVHAARQVTSAVVNIKILQERSGFHFFRGNPQGASSGSGVVISADGYIVTNFHVIEGAGQILVTLNDKREMPAALIGTDPSTDLALLRVEGLSLQPVAFGNSDSLQVGEWVLAVGNPFNLESTVTAGIVSAKGRSIDILEGMDRIESFIQTDAAVNPGNSGGALVNTRGELVGINTAIITRSGRYEGYSFAVPSNLVRKVIADLRDFGVVQRGLLGVFIEDLSPQSARRLGFPAPEGVLITRISPGSGAEDAGLRPGDVILRINGLWTPSVPRMQEQVGRYRPGDILRIEYWRDGKTRRTKVTLKNKNNSTEIVQANDAELIEILGLELRNLSSRERNRLQTNGIKVISVRKGSIVDATNMRPDFIITRVNNQKVGSTGQLVSALRKAAGSRVTLRGFYEGDRDPYYYVFNLQE